MNIIIYGTRKCSETRKAERFFRERRIPAQFRDIAEKPLTDRELKNIAAGHSRSELIDPSSKSYEKRGLAYMDFDAFDELLADSSLLVTPVIRVDKKNWIRPDLEKLPL